MDISNSIDSTFLLSKEMAKTFTTSTAMLLAFLYEKEKQAALRRGMGEVPLEKLIAGAAAGDSIKYMTVDPRDWASLRQYVQNSDIKNYTVSTCTKVIDGKPVNSKMVCVAESDLDKLNRCFQMMYAERGMLNEMRKDDFLALAGNKKLHVMENPEPELVELFDHYARQEPDKLPYTVVHLDHEVPNDNGEPTHIRNTYLVSLQEDKEAFENAIRHASAVLSSPEQGAMVRSQVQYRIKGKQEINIALEDAQRESIIIDRVDPSAYIKVTAEDFTYYENNKEISRIPRTSPDAVEKIYDRIEGMAEPVVTNEGEYFSKEPKEREKLLNQKLTVPSGLDWTVNIDENRFVPNARAAVEYRKSFKEYDVDMEDAHTLETAIHEAEREEKETEAVEKSRSKDREKEVSEERD